MTRILTPLVSAIAPSTANATGGATTSICAWLRPATATTVASKQPASSTSAPVGGPPSAEGRR